MKLREGMTYRIYDGKRFVIALDPSSHEGIFSPEIHIYNKRVPYASWWYKKTIKVPYIPWRFAYKHRKWGMVKISVKWERIIYTLFIHPQVKASLKELRKGH